MSERSSSSCLYFGRVMHERLRPVRHRFQYGVWSVLFDLDEVPTLAKRFTLFSFNRPNVVSFYECDHGPRDGSPLRPWIDGHLRAISIDLEGGAVRLLCFPRLLGYVFNPLSVWFCHHRDGGLVAVLLQVSNLHGEWHNYLFEVAAGADGRLPSAQFDKQFSVSAFTRMNAWYRCALVEPGEHMNVVVREFEQDGETLVAHWNGKRREITRGRLLFALARYPLMTFRITGAIYWQAIQLLRKGVRRQPQSPPPDVEVSHPMGATLSLRPSAHFD